MFKNIKISSRITVLVLVFVLLLISAISINLFQLRSIRTEIHHIAERDIPMTQTMTEITKNQLEQSMQFARLIRFGKARILNTTAKSSFIDADAAFNNLSEQVTKNLNLAVDMTKEAMKSKTQDSLKHFQSVLKDLNQIRSIHNDYTFQVKKVTELLIDNQFSQAELKSQKIETQVDKLNVQIRALLAKIVRFASDGSKQADQKEQFTQKFMYSLSFLAIALALFLGFTVTRSIIDPLHLSVTIAKTISEGQSHLRFPESGRDEISLLDKTMNDMLDTIKEKEKALIQANVELEDRVKQRTLQLEQKNKLLDQNNKELAKLNEIKNQFLGMAAHDLRNPLGIISGYADLILMGAMGDLTDKQKQVLQKIKKNGQTMLNLVNNLLDISVIESGNLNLKPVQLDNPQSFFKEIQDANSILAQAKSIDLKFEIEDLPTITLDPNYMTQVLNNLISNAIKFSHAHTTITVSLKRTSKHTVIKVSDQGQGIPASEIPKLFREYSQTSVTSTAGEKSTGLGLAIVKRVVEGHNGRIRVESEVGKGSDFIIQLPL